MSDRSDMSLDTGIIGAPIEQLTAMEAATSMAVYFLGKGDAYLRAARASAMRCMARRMLSSEVA